MADEPTVPLREHIEALMESEARHRDALRAADQRAVETALQRNSEVMALHNDLIRKGERAAATYITRGQVYAAIGTMLVVVGLLIAWEGIG